MERRTYQVRFNTPAFLGNAEQQGQWRTPPFKALLRQWWRVVKANELLSAGIEPRRLHEALREQEGQLFGHAFLEHGGKSWAMRSRVTVKLKPWDMGRRDMPGGNWPEGRLDKVVTTRDGKGKVRSDVYLGFGPVLPASRNQGRPHESLSHPPAIEAGDTTELQLGWPVEEQSPIEQTLGLIQWFGTLGSRARNGWGSIQIDHDGNTLPFPTPDGGHNLNSFLRDWRECLELEWPHAIGCDENRSPLVWITRPLVGDWRRAIEELAKLKVDLRRVAKEFRGPRRVGGVLLLGYPAGGDWEVQELPRDARWATQIRFKVVRTAQGLQGVVAHLPCKTPAGMERHLGSDQRDWLAKNQESVWKAIHEILDGRLKRMTV